MRWIRDEATEAIIALDPKRSAESTLALLLTHTPAKVAALFHEVEGDLHLFANCGVYQKDLEAANGAWNDGRESLLAGHTYSDDGFALVPLNEAHGFVYLSADPPGPTVNMDHIEQLKPLFVAALREPAHRPRPIVNDVAAMPTVEFERERLEQILERNEWNIARVARILDVERSTVYRRMERLGIPRQRPKRG